MPFFKTPPSGFDAILNRPAESAWNRLLSSPLTTIARYLYDSFPVSFPTPPRGEGAVTVVCISDTHNTQPHLPPGDILVHAGDLTVSGTRKELREAVEWIKQQPHRFKVAVAGNHDLCLDDSFAIDEMETDPDEDLDWGDVIYLNGTSTTLKVPVYHEGGTKTRTMRVYGSPYTPEHGNWAFQYPRSSASNPWTGVVPLGTDILVTHAPPKGHMDNPTGHWGCEMLLEEVWRVRPRLHVFGHVHCGHGVEAIGFDEVQRAWEDVVLENSREGGCWIWNGGKGMRAFMRILRAWLGVWWTGGRRERGETVLLNAAAVGGLRDRLIREAIVVSI